MKKMMSTIGFLGLGAVLAGCDTGVADAMDITEQLETTEKTIVDQLNTITSQEANLQTEFETTLAEDEELSTLSDGSAPVFENIGTRQTSLESLQVATDELKTHAEELTALEGGELPQEEITTLSDDMATLTSSLDAFIAQYGESLEQQEAYFTSLTAEDATYETLSSGLEQINTSHSADNELLTELDNNLVQLQSSRSTTAESLSAIEESE